MDSLSGAVERITFYNPENGYIVFPVVVMPVVTQHYTILRRNLLYTAVTQRFTALEWWLQGGEKLPAHQ